MTVVDFRPSLKVVILGAGQGRRLLPLTESRPKALVSVGERMLVEWQISSLMACGVREVVFVTGFEADSVVSVFERLRTRFPLCRFRTLYNPFYRWSDNLVTCWRAKAEMTGDFLLINGDTLFEPSLCARLLAVPPAPVTAAIDRKPAYDGDDMKVQLQGSRLVRVGKHLDPDGADGEAIGLWLFRGHGCRAFADGLDNALQHDAAMRRWYPSVIDDIAATTSVRGCSIEGYDWCEIDSPSDLTRAERLVGTWTDRDVAATPAAALA